MTDWPALIGAMAATLTPVGGAIGFIWSKVERRFASIESQLVQCEKREGACLDRSSRQLTVIELLWNALEQANPQARELKRSKHLLEDLRRETREAQAE